MKRPGKEKKIPVIEGSGKPGTDNSRFFYVQLPKHGYEVRTLNYQRFDIMSTLSWLAGTQPG